MFKDTNRLLSEQNYDLVGPSPGRVWTLLKRNKKMIIHIVLHFVIELILLVVGFGVACSALLLTKHPTGVKMVIMEMTLSAMSLLLYVIYLVLLVLALRTHPVFTLITNRRRPFFFTKLANKAHRLYMIILVCNFMVSILLSMSFNPTNRFKHPVNGLWVLIVVDIIYLQLSCSELQAPITTTSRKVETVSMGDKAEDQYIDESIKDTVGVWTFGYNIVGFQVYIKYHFNPNDSVVGTEAYFVGWVKNFN